jgi:hypothetical protein
MVRRDEAEDPDPLLPEDCVMLRSERPPVSRVWEIHKHGLKGGLDFDTRSSAVEG